MTGDVAGEVRTFWNQVPGTKWGWDQVTCYHFYSSTHKSNPSKNKCMCILIKKLFLWDITWSVGYICIEVGENVFSKIGELIGQKYVETVDLYACW